MVAMSSKIPKAIILALLTACFDKMFTPPFKPPPKEELASTIKIDIPSVRRLRLTLVRSGQAIAALAEIVTILVQLFPAHRLSPHVLSTLLGSNATTADLSFRRPQIAAATIWGIAAIVRLSAIGKLGRFFHYDISIQKDHELVTTGAYSWVRHPSYSGILLVSTGLLLWYGEPGSWLRQSVVMSTPIGRATVALYLLMGIIPINFITLGRMKREDEILQEKFGDKWVAWRKRVPYSVIPWIY